ncbi:sensor histidine kinase [Microbacterium sp. RD1]|uniref:sensor histidine kinase n=1 Tax=Microbacterium sp. RD1 TaxID=3457313 RepID=UPI003FA584B6
MRATWWYTASSVVFLHVTTLFLWGGFAILRGGWLPPVAGSLAFVAGSALSLASAVVLLIRYRRYGDDDDAPRGTAWIVVIGVLGAALTGLAAQSLLFGAALAGYVLCLVRWRAGVRGRLAVALLLGLTALAVIEVQVFGLDRPLASGIPLLFFAVALAPLTVVSLWWWDIVRELDRARVAEGRLAAAQERLRLAGDLHDLQGHHLQVIALQLELAERTMDRDPAAAGEHVRAARASVDDARRGTRELAARFRGVPLPDELANAADLLRAAGLRVDLDVAGDAADAPSEVLGPIIRESTTNVLKHGGGAWARLALRRQGDRWMLEIANDPAQGESAVGAGSGLTGIAERVKAVGGQVAVEPTVERFVVVVSVPASPVDAVREGDRRS